MLDEWAKVAAAMLLHVELVKVYMTFLRARCALAAVSHLTDPGTALKIASGDARRLGRMRPAWARAAAHQIRAALAHRSENLEMAIAELDRAIEGFTTDHLDLHLWCARLRRGQLLGNEKGAEEIAAAERWMTDQGIRNPEAMTRVNTPGFDPR